MKNMPETTVDIAIIGAGIAGLVCARQLHQADYRVVVLEKSRGLGGRVATRRLEGAWADHGTRYLESQGKQSEAWLKTLCDRGIVQPWTDCIDQWISGDLVPMGKYPRYAASDGLTAIAKDLGMGLDIRRQQRVVAIAPETNGWTLTQESPSGDPLGSLTAKAIVIAIPAPQAVILLEPLVTAGLSADFLTQVQSVQFDPCLSAIATYPLNQSMPLDALPWRGVAFPKHPNLSWVGIESSKQVGAKHLVVVVQSSAALAAQSLQETEQETDLQRIGQQVLTQAAHALGDWLATPTTLQVHRWRYAFAHTPLSTPYLATTQPHPLVCSGDWCGGRNVESALESGLAAADAVNRLLSQD